MPDSRPFKFPDALLKAPEPETLSPPGRRRKLLLWTAAVHAAILLVPLVLWTIGDWLFSKPKNNTITVTISGAPGPVKKRSSGRRAPRLRPPKAQPALKKPQLKPAPKPEPKVQPKPAVKTRPVPAKSSAKTAKTVKTPPKKTAPQKKEDPWQDLRPAEQNPPQETPQQSQTEDAGEPSEGVSYDENLVGTLYELWKPPSDALLAGRRPVVLTRITVNPAGRVLKAEILRRSGFGPMDESVQKLLRSLTDLPKPPKGHLTFEIEFTPYE